MIEFLHQKMTQIRLLMYNVQAEGPYRCSRAYIPFRRVFHMNNLLQTYIGNCSAGVSLEAFDLQYCDHVYFFFLPFCEL
jgi:hypothetical protein